MDLNGGIVLAGTSPTSVTVPSGRTPFRARKLRVGRLAIPAPLVAAVLAVTMLAGTAFAAFFLFQGRATLQGSTTAVPDLGYLYSGGSGVYLSSDLTAPSTGTVGGAWRTIGTAKSLTGAGWSLDPTGEIASDGQGFTQIRKRLDLSIDAYVGERITVAAKVYIPALPQGRDVVFDGVSGFPSAFEVDYESSTVDEMVTALNASGMKDTYNDNVTATLDTVNVVDKQPGFRVHYLNTPSGVWIIFDLLVTGEFSASSAAAIPITVDFHIAPTVVV